jgi:hypothetical protein
LGTGIKVERCELVVLAQEVNQFAVVGQIERGQLVPAATQGSELGKVGNYSQVGKRASMASQAFQFGAIVQAGNIGQAGVVETIQGLESRAFLYIQVGQSTVSAVQGCQQCVAQNPEPIQLAPTGNIERGQFVLADKKGLKIGQTPYCAQIIDRAVLTIQIGQRRATRQAGDSGQIVVVVAEHFLHRGTIGHIK